ncbi:MAG TPA: hypothetical protein GX002_03930 [Clostridiales bacterium]|jgi:YD repeat-containing protein|nr:hypothetical protein [Clostridiales bacterium]
MARVQESSSPIINGQIRQTNLRYDSYVTYDATTGNGTVTYPDGRTVEYEYVNGQYKSPDAVYDKLVRDTDGTYSLILKNKTIYEYNSSGKLASISDKNGNTITIQYNSSGHITQVTGASGKKLVFSLQLLQLK